MRVIVELEGARLEVPQEEIANIDFNVRGDVEEVPCDCPNGPCRGIHRKLTGVWNLDLSLTLNAQPMWEQVN